MTLNAIIIVSNFYICINLKTKAFFLRLHENVHFGFDVTQK